MVRFRGSTKDWGCSGIGVESLRLGVSRTSAYLAEPTSAGARTQGIFVPHGPKLSRVSVSLRVAQYNL